ncbi:MAG: hypothetical protein IPM69_11705 [Ignavibacteria bacterium]|nr:hypothetical protein [Ignavibacteria bacterium]
MGLVQLTLLTSGADSSFIKSNSASTPILKGLMLRLAPVSLALPIFNNNLYAGTSLFNIIVLGQNQFGAGILPVRLGFWQPLNENELSVEPFIEYNYFPSNFVHIGGKFNLKFGTTSNFFAQIGWVNGNTSNSIGEILTKHFGVAQSFTGLYFGIGVGILDRIFPAKDLRYNK